MRLFVLLALAGAVAAFSLSPSRTSLISEKELKYQFVSQVLTGIPQLNSQYSGFRLTGQSTIQPEDEKTFRVKLSNMKYLSSNDQLELSEEWEILSSEEHELPSQLKQQLEAPFKVAFNPSGQVEAVYSESSEPEFVTNIKKSLININFDWLQGSRMIDTNQIHRDNTDQQQPRSYFKVMEKSLEGECEAEYTVHQMADYQIAEFEKTGYPCRDYYQVVKSINYQNCRERPLYQRSVGSQARSDGTSGASSPYLTESSVSRTIWCGPVTYPMPMKQTTEQKVVVNGNGKFESQEKIEVTSRVTQSLISVSSKTSDIPEPQSPKKSHDLTFSFPSGDFWTSSSSSSSESYLAQPSDMTSHPTTPYPRLGSEEAKTRFVSQFVSMKERDNNDPEEADIHSTTGHLSYLSTMLSYEDINDCWSRIQQRISHEPLAVKEDALNVFADILSLAMGPTNPSIKFIAEKIKNKQIKGESAAWIAANVIRSVQTPTEKTIQELINLLKDSSVQRNRDLKATVAMSLTEMIYKACVDETSSSYNYPKRVYGKFCSPSSKVIKVDLIPYLKQSLTDLKPELREAEPGTSAMNKLITLINALGNLGIEEASQALLEVVEGDYSQHPHPRSVAVYKLIRSARQNPTKYRPVILTIINNNAEDEEVRMAAITALPAVQPSSAQLQKMAALTWYDSQQQVASFISSTLESLSQLPSGSEESLSHLSQKAGEALKLAKPTNSSGIHKSQNIEIKQFLETLKASVGLKLQYVNSEESAFPRTMFLQSEISSKAQTMKPWESSVYLQGADTFLDELYNGYKYWSQLSHQQKPEEKLTYEPRQTRKPEAHVTLKMFDLQRFFSVDYEYMQQVAMEMAKEMSQQGAVKKDYMKVLDLSYHQAILPTVSGLPLYLHHRTPLVVSAHTSLTRGRAGSLEMKTKPRLSYQQRTRVGTLCPFSQQYLGAGVQTSLNVSLPLRSELSLQNGQVSITLKTPEDAQSQRDKSVVQFTVNPYTFNEGIFDSQEQQRQQYKTIHTKSSKHQRQYQVGRPLGVDLKLKVESEHQFSDLASIVNSLAQHRPLTALSLPLPLQSCRYHQVSLHYRPARSQTKEASFIFSLGYGSKQSLFGEPKVHFPLEFQSGLERECRQEITENKWIQQAEPEDSEDEEEERKYWRENSQDGYRQKLKAKLSEERRVYQCLTVKKCDQEKSNCQSELRSEHRPRDEIEAVCSQKKFQCVQHTKTAISTKSLLYKLSQGTSVTCSAAVVLRTENQEKKAEVRTTVGQSSGSDARTKVQVTASWQPTSTSEPQQVIFSSSSQVSQARSKWNKNYNLRQRIGAQVDLKLSYGQKNQAKQSASASIEVSQSGAQKSHARQSWAARQCEEQKQEGRTLTEQCKEARRQASSLDTIQAQVSLPASLSQSWVLKTLSDLSKAYVAPYIEAIQYQQGQTSSVGDNQYQCTIKIHPEGQQFSVNVRSQENDLKLKDIRVVKSLQGLLPINIQDTGSENIIQKLTSRQAPSTCSIEYGRVKTFDNLEYDYQLNDCEHVVFKDCSQSSRVEVSVQEKSSKKTVKVTIDNHQYELKVPTSSGNQQAVIKVNGEEKSYMKKQVHEKRKEVEEKKENREWQHTSKQEKEQQEIRKAQREKTEFAEQKKNFYEDAGTYVTSYEDGVYGVISARYGIAVYTDGKSVEVQTYQHLLRNKACGLCGDLNDERVGDVKSPGSCIMSSPSLAAQTYMIQDQTCGAPSSQDQERIRRETEQQCVRKQTFPTRVSQIYSQAQPLYSKHLVEQRDNKICFSTQQVKVCPSHSNPQQITQKEVSYYCLPKDSKSQRMQKMAEQGEFIPQQEERYPLSYTKVVSQPEQC